MERIRQQPSNHFTVELSIAVDKAKETLNQRRNEFFDIVPVCCNQTFDLEWFGLAAGLAYRNVTYPYDVFGQEREALAAPPARLSKPMCDDSVDINTCIARVIGVPAVSPHGNDLGLCLATH